MRPGLRGVAFLATFTLAAHAGAFCRARGCDPNAETCAIEDGCITTGPDLHWGERCIVTVAAQRDGSVMHGIDHRALQSLVHEAFQSWADVDCGAGKRPSIGFQLMDAAECDVPAYNDEAGNANVIMIRDDAWPYVGGVDELGHTTVTYDAESGEIWDVDIEINGDGVPLTLDVSDGGADLGSIIAHEAGHFLGLAHSTDREATMFPSTDFGTTKLASLADDDAAGVCAIYPPSPAPLRASCNPRNGYSDTCTGGPRTIAPNPLPGEPLCALGARSHAPNRAGGWLFIGALTWVGSRRRRSAR